MATSSKVAKIHVAEVVRSGEKLIVPVGMSLRAAQQVLHQQEQYEEQSTGINATIDGLLYEAAYAFHQACAAMFGWVRGVPTPGFFGENPPAMLTVPVSRTESIQVPWGGIGLPVVEGYLELGATRVNGKFVAQISGMVKRKHEHQVRRLVDDTRRRVREESLYRGKAWRLRLRDDDGNALPLPEPQFLNLEHAPDPEALIFNRNVARQIETNLFTVIRQAEAVKAAGVPLKRGVLLSGRYGTGKSLTAAATARLCEAHGWTFIECERADEIATILKLAQSYGRTCVFCEDIDQVLTGERDMTMNDILNVIDGVEAKSAEVLVVLTTNHVDEISRAMIRPGRIDALIEMEPPDAAAAVRLVELYARGRIAPGEDLAPVGERLAGQIPSMIADIVRTSTLHALSLSAGQSAAITAAALLEAAESKATQMRLLAKAQPDRRSEREKAAAILAEALAPAPTNGHAAPALVAA